MAQSIKTAVANIAGLTLRRILTRLLAAIKADFANRTALVGSATWDVADLATGAQESKEVTVTGAALGDFVIASLGVDVADLAVSAQVTAANTVTVTVLNETGGNVNLASTTVRAMVIPKAAFQSANLIA